MLLRARRSGRMRIHELPPKRRVALICVKLVCRYLLLLLLLLLLVRRALLDRCARRSRNHIEFEFNGSLDDSLSVMVHYACARRPIFRAACCCRRMWMRVLPLLGHEITPHTAADSVQFHTTLPN